MSFGTEGSLNPVYQGTILRLTVVKVNQEAVLEQPVKLGVEYKRTWDWVANDLAGARILQEDNIVCRGFRNRLLERRDLAIYCSA